ncbi:MAG: hypothetical protein LQ345_004757 [Seirophora villosa]|nr:MAG: hypothetical protein LQ345_004757 [Seirophora villosa]
MNATAYLTRHGWRGDGHALHPSGNGIKKPLTVSKKTNRLGVGKKAHDVHADQWWSRAFDETLRSINDQSAVEDTAETNATSPQLGIYAAKWSGSSGLYSNFTRGHGLKGTIGATRDTVDHAFDRHRADSESPFDNFETFTRGNDPESARMALEQHSGDPPSSRSSINFVESSSKTEPLTDPGDQTTTVFSDTQPQQKVPKSRRKRVLIDSTVTRSVAMTRKVECGHMEVVSASPAADGGLETTLQNDRACERSKRQKGRRLEKEASKMDLTLTQGRSKDKSAQVVKKRKNRRKDEKE